MFMQVLNRYTFSSIALVSFVLCLAAELKKTKKDDLVFNGKLCYLPTSSSFELGITGLICLSITQVAGSLFIYREFTVRGLNLQSHAVCSFYPGLPLELQWFY
ncbi:protein MODIFYING WALL LIGNIN-2-like [Salvia splendens]|uniref:protein MODIFYING WALL LIGNIN-2-like n=1 Tax=Salvia splendens TaxID=180675 RepID=UPI001C258875|nr:protein MODIFYING WALL LIGNIN-2-like [Salvia splendens]